MNLHRIKEVVKVLLNEEYSEKVLIKLVDKFKSENPEVDTETIQDYIKRFDQIKNGPNITNKDISTYTFDELESAVIDSVRVIKPKSFKGSDDLSLVYNGDGLNIFLADTKEKCIKYGEGYTFCISAHGEDNRYDEYRFDMFGTPYFIFNHRMSSSKDDESGDYWDPDHLMVLFVYEAPPTQAPDDYVDYTEDKEMQFKNMTHYYSVSDAENKGETFYMNFSTIETYFPHLKGLEKVFVPKELSQKEQRLVDINDYAWKQIEKINEQYKGESNECDKSLIRYTHYDRLFQRDESAPVWHTDRYHGHLEAYKNGYRVTYTVFRPHLNENLIMSHHLSKQYYGPNGFKECEKFIDFSVKFYTDNLKKSIKNGGELGFESTAQIRPKTVKDNYEIVECKWSPEYINYMKEIYNLRNKILFMKWRVEKDY